MAAARRLPSSAEDEGEAEEALLLFPQDAGALKRKGHPGAGSVAAASAVVRPDPLWLRRYEAWEESCLSPSEAMSSAGGQDLFSSSAIEQQQQQQQQQQHHHHHHHQQHQQLLLQHQQQRQGRLPLTLPSYAQAELPAFARDLVLSPSGDVHHLVKTEGLHPQSGIPLWHRILGQSEAAKASLAQHPHPGHGGPLARSGSSADLATSQAMLDPGGSAIPSLASPKLASPSASGSLQSPSSRPQRSPLMITLPGASADISASSGGREEGGQGGDGSPGAPAPVAVKKKRSLPGTPGGHPALLMRPRAEG